MKQKRAFTIIELIVVIAIIVILIAVLLPTIDTTHRPMVRILCASHMHQVVLAIQNYASNNKGKLPILNGTKGNPPVEQAFTPTNLRSAMMLNELLNSGYLPGGENTRVSLTYDPPLQSNAIDGGASGHYYWNPHPADASVPLPVPPTSGSGVSFDWPKPQARWTQLSQIPKGRVLGTDLIYSPVGTAHHGSGPTQIGYWNLAFADGSVHTVQSADLMTRFLIPLSKSKTNNTVSTWPQLNDAIRCLELLDQGIDPKRVDGLDGTKYYFELGIQNQYYPPCPPDAPEENVQR